MSEYRSWDDMLDEAPGSLGKEGALEAVLSAIDRDFETTAPQDAYVEDYQEAVRHLARANARLVLGDLGPAGITEALSREEPREVPATASGRATVVYWYVAAEAVEHARADISYFDDNFRQRSFQEPLGERIDEAVRYAREVERLGAREADRAAGPVEPSPSTPAGLEAWLLAGHDAWDPVTGTYLHVLEDDVEDSPHTLYIEESRIVAPAMADLLARDPAYDGIDAHDANPARVVTATGDETSAWEWAYPEEGSGLRGAEWCAVDRASLDAALASRDRQVLEQRLAIWRDRGWRVAAFTTPGGASWVMAYDTGGRDLGELPVESLVNVDMLRWATASGYGGPVTQISHVDITDDVDVAMRYDHDGRALRPHKVLERPYPWETASGLEGFLGRVTDGARGGGARRTDEPEEGR